MSSILNSGSNQSSFISINTNYKENEKTDMFKLDNIDKRYLNMTKSINLSNLQAYVASSSQVTPDNKHRTADFMPLKKPEKTLSNFTVNFKANEYLDDDISFEERFKMFIVEIDKYFNKYSTLGEKFLDNIKFESNNNISVNNSMISEESRKLLIEATNQTNSNNQNQDKTVQNTYNNSTLSTIMSKIRNSRNPMRPVIAYFNKNVKNNKKTTDWIYINHNKTVEDKQVFCISIMNYD